MKRMLGCLLLLCLGVVSQNETTLFEVANTSLASDATTASDEYSVPLDGPVVKDVSTAGAGSGTVLVNPEARSDAEQTLRDEMAAYQLRFDRAWRLFQTAHRLGVSAVGLGVCTVFVVLVFMLNLYVRRLLPHQQNTREQLDEYFAERDRTRRQIELAVHQMVPLQDDETHFNGKRELLEAASTAQPTENTTEWRDRLLKAQLSRSQQVPGPLYYRTELQTERLLREERCPYSEAYWTALFHDGTLETLHRFARTSDTVSRLRGWCRLNERNALLHHTQPMSSLEHIMEMPLPQYWEMRFPDNTSTVRQQQGQLLQQAAAGLTLLHEWNVLARDVQPNSWMVDFSDATRPRVFFGRLMHTQLLARGRPHHTCDMQTEDTQQMLSGTQLALLYCAPEVLHRADFFLGSDVWAYAMVVYRLLFAEDPFRLTLETPYEKEDDDAAEMRASLLLTEAERRQQNRERLMRHYQAGHRPLVPLGETHIPNILQLKTLLQHCWQQRVSDRCMMSHVRRQLREVFVAAPSKTARSAEPSAGPFELGEEEEEVLERKKEEKDTEKIESTSPTSPSVGTRALGTAQHLVQTASLKVKKKNKRHLREKQAEAKTQ